MKERKEIKSRAGKRREKDQTVSEVTFNCKILNQPSVPSSAPCIQLANAGREPYALPCIGGAPACPTPTCCSTD